MRTRILKAALASAMFGIAGCGGGGGGGGAPSSATPPPPTMRTVALSWVPNRETAVNRPGGGYHVIVDGAVAATVPFGTGPLALTETMIELPSGTHVIQMRAFSNFNGGTTSAPSAPVAVTVP